MIHELKTDPQPFEDVLSRRKPYEIRFNDRDFKTGDQLWLRETRYTGHERLNGKPLEYTGRELRVNVTAIMRNIYGREDGWCILTIDW